MNVGKMDRQQQQQQQQETRDKRVVRKNKQQDDRGLNGAGNFRLREGRGRIGNT